MRRRLFVHWRTTAAGLVLGVATMLGSVPDITSMPWKEIAKHAVKACAIVGLGCFARDFERGDDSDV